jgi:hypothetical protein
MFLFYLLYSKQLSKHKLEAAMQCTLNSSSSLSLPDSADCSAEDTSNS